MLTILRLVMMGLIKPAFVSAVHPLMRMHDAASVDRISRYGLCDEKKN